MSNIKLFLKYWNLWFIVWKKTRGDKVLTNYGFSSLMKRRKFAQNKKCVFLFLVSINKINSWFLPPNWLIPFCVNLEASSLIVDIIRPINILQYDFAYRILDLLCTGKSEFRNDCVLWNKKRFRHYFTCCGKCTQQYIGYIQNVYISIKRKCQQFSKWKAHPTIN